MVDGERGGIGDLETVFSDVAAPPTERGAVGDLGPASSWPTVVGVCGIVYASFGLMGGCAGFASYFWMQAAPSVMGSISQQGSGAGSGTGSVSGPAAVFGSQSEQAMLQTQADYAWITLVLAVGFFAVAAWLLIASIGVVRRRGWSGRQTVMSCVARVVLGLVQAGTTVFVMFETLAAMRATPDYDPSFDFMMMGGMIFGVVFAVVWTLLYPGFALVWFARKKVRAEVSGWGGGSIEGEARFGDPGGAR